MITIDSQYAIIDHLPNLPVSVDLIKNEPMLFNCDYDHAIDLGGRLTNNVLAILPVDWKTVPLVIDSRVHMLMPGWFPCIPGWHHDDVPRTRADGQPNYLDPKRDRSEHLMCLVNADICPTAFATGKVDIELPAEGGVIYAQWHGEVERLIKEGKLTKSLAPNGSLIKFNDDTFHTGTPANAGGWRFFIRISRYYDYLGNPIARRNNRTNEIRRQVQVYLENPNAGW